MMLLLIYLKLSLLDLALGLDGSHAIHLCVMKPFRAICWGNREICWQMHERLNFLSFWMFVFRLDIISLVFLNQSIKILMCQEKKSEAAEPRNCIFRSHKLERQEDCLGNVIVTSLIQKKHTICAFSTWSLCNRLPFLHGSLQMPRNFVFWLWAFLGVLQGVTVSLQLEATVTPPPQSLKKQRKTTSCCLLMEWLCFFQGSVAIAGAVVRWLRDNLGIAKTSQEVGEYEVVQFFKFSNVTMSLLVNESSKYLGKEKLEGAFILLCLNTTKICFASMNSLLSIHVFHRAYQPNLGNALSALLCCNLYFLAVSLVSRYSGGYYTYRVSPGFIQCWSFQSQEYLSLYYRNQPIFDPKPTYSCHKCEHLRPCICKYLCRRFHIHWSRDLSLQSCLFKKMWRTVICFG